MNIYVEKHTEHNRWWVRMDDWRVSFNSSTEAEQFVERLNARLDAPHSPDMLAHSTTRTGVAAWALLRYTKES